MKRTSAMLVALVCAAAVAQAPSVNEPVRVALADGSVLDIGEIAHAAPEYADITGDGVPDLLVGQFENGYIRIYKNYGTADEPVFRDYEFMTAGGDTAIVPPY